MSRSPVRRLALLAVALCYLSAAPETRAQKKDGGEIVGKLWEFETTKGKEAFRSGQVRVKGFEMFGPKGRLYGTYKMLGQDHMEITFVAGPLKGYAGNLRLAERKPPKWVGFASKEGEDKLHFTYTFLKD